MNYRKRIRSLRALVNHPVLITHPHDVLYYTGYRATTDDHPLLLVRPKGRPLLFLSPLEGRTRVAAEVRTSGFLRALPKTLGIDEAHLSLKLHSQIKSKRIIKQVGSLIKKPREVKDSQELARIRRGIRLNRKVLKATKWIGHTEAAVARSMERRFFEAGAEPAFEIIVAAGRNAGTRIHHVPTRHRISPREMVIIDFGSRIEGYSTDVTRTYYDSRNKKQQKLVDTIRSVQADCIDLVQPGARMKDINQAYEKAFKRARLPVRHGIGHGVGISVHEPASVLERGMVITIEPGAYLKSIGCRIEDMILVKNKPEVLTRSIRQP